jgi:hypothetical protein
MKLSNLTIGVAMLAVFSSVLACGGTLSTANIGDTWLATDEAGDNRTTVFTSTDTFNLFVTLNNAPDDTVLKANWLAVNAEGFDSNQAIYETEYTSSDDVIRFYLTNDNLWGVGDYKVDIYLNGNLNKTLTFSVQ